MTFRSIALLFMYCLTLPASAEDAPKPQETARSHETATLIGAGDIADCTGGGADESPSAFTARLVDALLAEADRKGESAHIFTVGDNTYPDGTPREFDECYRHTWGRFRDRTLPALGNHDRGNGSADGSSEAFGFYGYFDARLKIIDKEQNASSGSISKGYYKFELNKSWLVLVLDSTYADTSKPKFPDPPAMFREEEAWLKEVLDKKPTDQCVIAVWHHPVCGGTDICDDFMNSIWRLLQGKAGLVVTGHEHAYRRYLKMDGDRKPSPAGLLQITVGTGGSQNIFQFSERHAFTDRTAPEPCASSYGVLLLRLRGRVGEFEFVPWSAKDRPLVFDHGAFSCPTDK